MLKTLLVSAILAAALSVLPARAQAEDQMRLLRLLSLSGHGEVRAKPDMAVVRLGVMSRAETARAALDANSDAMAKVLASLKAAGIDEKDLQTSSFTVNPVYVYDNDNKEPPKITGYEVSNQVAATVRKLDTLGAILDRAVSEGSNQITGIAFTIDDPQALEDAARKAAVADAMRKAQVYAEAAGLKLGEVQSISEQVVRPSQPVMMKAERMDAANSEVPLAMGEQSVAIEVNMAWAIQ